MLLLQRPIHKAKFRRGTVQRIVCRPTNIREGARRELRYAGIRTPARRKRNTGGDGAGRQIFLRLKKVSVSRECFPADADRSVRPILSQVIEVPCYPWMIIDVTRITGLHDFYQTIGTVIVSMRSTRYGGQSW